MICIVISGCGSGQFTYKLSTLFPNDQIIGIDKSIEQLKYAKPNTNITYKVGTALESNLNNSSIDVITVAQAAHWFDMPVFIKEMKRVLKPGGLLAIAGYSFCQSYNASINSSIRRYEATIKDCWPSGCNRTRLDSTFADVDFTSYFNYSTRKSFPVIRNMEIDSFLAYIRTMSALQVYATKYPDMPDPTKILENEIKDILKGEKNIDICFPFFLFSMKDEVKQL